MPPPRHASRVGELRGADAGKATTDGLFAFMATFRYNACIHQCFERRAKGAGNMVNGLANNAEIDDSSNCDATVVLLKRGNRGEGPGDRGSDPGIHPPSLPLAALGGEPILVMGRL